MSPRRASCAGRPRRRETRPRRPAGNPHGGRCAQRARRKRRTAFRLKPACRAPARRKAGCRCIRPPHRRRGSRSARRTARRTAARSHRPPERRAPRPRFQAGKSPAAMWFPRACPRQSAAPRGNRRDRSRRSRRPRAERRAARGIPRRRCGSRPRRRCTSCRLYRRKARCCRRARRGGRRRPAKPRR